MTEPLNFDRGPSHGARCSRCQTTLLYLNKYGMCADCWANLSELQRASLVETAVRVVSQTVYKPAPRMRTTLALSAIVSAVMGFGAAVGTLVLMGFHR